MPSWSCGGGHLLAGLQQGGGPGRAGREATASGATGRGVDGRLRVSRCLVLRGAGSAQYGLAGSPEVLACVGQGVLGPPNRGVLLALCQVQALLGRTRGWFAHRPPRSRPGSTVRACGCLLGRGLPLDGSVVGRLGGARAARCAEASDWRAEVWSTRARTCPFRTRSPGSTQDCSDNSARALEVDVHRGPRCDVAVGRHRGSHGPGVHDCGLGGRLFLTTAAADRQQRSGRPPNRRRPG